ncbi:hypothetical protein BGW39_003421 [Mortierella sp. 14UC]|nr:hypothetical protein BGW39_003421 [Mortierella sp. 14UC]
MRIFTRDMSVCMPHQARLTRRFFLIALIAIAASLSVFASAYTIHRRSIGLIQRQAPHTPPASSTPPIQPPPPPPPPPPPAQQQLYKPDIGALEDLVKRLLPEPYHSLFQFTLRSDLSTNSATNIHDTFRIYNNEQADSSGIVIEGATMSALGAGVNHYLKEVCKVEMAWSGDRFDQLPTVPPRISAEAGVDGVVRASFVPWRYYMNVVTFGYSFAFWDWKRWQRELDWMMLNGVNMALAMTGQEYVVRKFYETQGLSSDDISDFLGGPAFMPWQRMGNIQGSWTNVKDAAFKNEWIDSQWELQGQIMQRMQAFNITPIMPSFQGFVPRKLPEKYPSAKFDRSSVWVGMPKEFTQVTFLPSTEPLFTTLSQQFIQLQRAMYKEKGIDMDVSVQNFYILDLYNEMTPTCTTPACLKAATAGVMKAFKAADPKAVWAMQSWFLLDRGLWKAPQIQAYFDGIREVNNGRDAFVVDLYADVSPLWTTTEGFYGIDWGWSMLNNFGGGQGLYGTLSTLLTDPFKGYRGPSKSMRGMGITMEGINNNEYLYQLIFDLPWQSVEATYPTAFAAPVIKPGTYALQQQALSGQALLENYIKRRYGPEQTTPAMLESWTTLSQTAWDCKSGQISQSKAIISSIPGLDMTRKGFMPTEMCYDQAKVVDAWKQLVESTETEESNKRRRRHSFIQDSIEAVVMASNGRSSEIPQSSASPSPLQSFSNRIKSAYTSTVGQLKPSPPGRQQAGTEGGGEKRIAQGRVSGTVEPVKAEVVGAPGSALPNKAALPLNVSSFQYDLVDVTREVLVGVVLPGLHRELVDAYNAKDLDRTRAWGQHVLDVIIDTDRLLSTHSHFMVGPWIRDARVSAKVVSTISATASTPASMNQYRDYLEYNARNQITWWGPQGQGSLADYASKEWGGVVKEYQYPRWQIFVDRLVSAVESRSSFDHKKFLADSLSKEGVWMKETTCLGGCYRDPSSSSNATAGTTAGADGEVTRRYPVEAVEDTALVAQDMVDRWGRVAARLAQASKNSSKASPWTLRRRARTLRLVAVFVLLVIVTFSSLFTVYTIHNKGALARYNTPSSPSHPDYYLPWNSTTSATDNSSTLLPPSSDGKSNATTTAAVPEETTAVTPLQELVKRLLPKSYHAHFQFTLRADLTTNSATNVHDTFRVYNLEGAGVAVEGVTLSALGAGLNHYLKHICNVEMTWSGDRFDQLPAVPPLIPAEAGVDGVVRASFVPWRYYMNVVTFGYSFAFWDWSRWQRELDWMMLNGINMALAMTGQEYVVRKFYENQGLKSEDIDDFLGGAAFMPWQRMGNIQGAWALQENTTFNNDWIDSQWALQGLIMQRMQAFNITPIMPSFQGFVPRKFREKHANSSFVTASNWNEMGKFSQVTALLPTEPLFMTLSQQFIQLQRTMYKDMGIDLDISAADNFYLLDLYNEMQPSCTEPSCLQAISAGVMKALKAADPKAVWVMQGWFLVHLYPWQPPQNKAFFDGIKEVNEGRDAFVIDLNSEVMPVWERTDGLDNFGGGQGLYGALPTLLTEPFKGFQQPAKSMRGMGITMEGINNNDYLYQLTLDIPWQSVEATYPEIYAAPPPARPGAFPLNQQGLSGQAHLKEFIRRRYGPDHTTPAMLEAWTVLSQTVWDCKTKQDSQSKTYLDNAPALDMFKPGFMRTVMWYDQNQVVRAWKQLVESTETELSKKRRRHHSVIQNSVEAVIMAANGRASEIESPASSPSVEAMLAGALSDWIKDVYEDILGRFRTRSSTRQDVVSRAVHDSILPSEFELPLNVSSFQYDLVDVTREVLLGVVLPGLHRELVDAYEAKDLDRTRAWGQYVLDLILDTDRLLSTHTHFMVGPWIRDARVSAKIVPTSNSPTASTPASMNDYRDYLEYSARNQITWWGPHGQGTLADYASKQWGGLVKEFYYPRWRIFVDHLVSAVETGATLNQTACHAESLVKEVEWMQETTCLGGCFADSSVTTSRVGAEATDKYPVEAVEDSVLVAQDLVDRWGQTAARLAKDAKLIPNEP